MSNESKIITEPSLVDLYIKVENLTASVLAAARKETSFQKSVGIKHEQIWNQLNAIKKSIDAQELNESAMTVEKLAHQLGLEIIEPDRMRGQYYGAVVGLDSRAWLIRVTSTHAMVLTFNEILENLNPRRGDNIRFGFKNGTLTASIQVHPSNVRADQAKLNQNLAV